MAEIFKSTDAGETAQHFVQFLMMYQQQTLHALGRIAGGSGANLALAKAFILQLGAIQQRTRGNLSGEEEKALSTTLASLEQKYLEAARSA